MQHVLCLAEVLWGAVGPVLLRLPLQDIGQ
jgi:hypothetical protein